MDAVSGRTERWLAALLLATYAWFFQSGQHNEAARLDLTRALVEHQTPQVDRFMFNSADIIRYEDGHYYSNKAPGASLLAVPIWAAGAAVLAQTPAPEWLRLHLLCWLCTILTVGAAGAAAAVLQLRFLRRCGLDDRIGLFAVLALALGTIAFPFSTLFFSHQIAATLVFGCFYAVFAHLDDLGRGVVSGRAGDWRSLLGGLAGGFAVTTDYPAAFALAAVGMYALLRLTRARQWRVLALLGTGVILGTLPLFAYNLIAFGKLWYTPLEAYAAADSTAYVAHQQGFLGLLNPFTNPAFVTAVAAVTVGSQRGLLHCNPVLWLVIPGFALSLLRDSRVASARRAEIGFAFGLGLLFVALNASYGTSVYYWGGGNSIGPRYLILALPFLGLPLAVALATRLGRVVGYGLAAISLLFMLAMTAVEPRASLDYSDPVLQLGLPYFVRGDLAICRDGIFSPQRMTSDSVAFNLGKLAGLPARWQLTPLYLLWALFAVRLHRAVGAPPCRRLALAGAALLAALTLTPPIHSWLRDPAIGAGGGLRGDYYDSPDFTGAPRWQQIDDAIQFDWSSDGRPFPGPFSVVWEGTIEIDRPGPHTFATESDDGSRVFIGGELVVDNSGAHGVRRADGICILEPGLHPIRVEFADYGFGALMRLSWRPPGAPADGPIPSRLLKPAAAYPSTSSSGGGVAAFSSAASSRITRCPFPTPRLHPDVRLDAFR